MAAMEVDQKGENDPLFGFNVEEASDLTLVVTVLGAGEDDKQAEEEDGKQEDDSVEKEGGKRVMDQDENRDSKRQKREVEPRSLDENESMGVAIAYEERIHVSRLKLFQRSEFFRTLFSGSWKDSKEREIKVELHSEAEREPFMTLLKFFYTGELDPNAAGQMDMLVLADRFGASSAFAAAVKCVEQQQFRPADINALLALPEHLQSLDSLKPLREKILDKFVKRFRPLVALSRRMVPNLQPDFDSLSVAALNVLVQDIAEVRFSVLPMMQDRVLHLTVNGMLVLLASSRLYVTSENEVWAMLWKWLKAHPEISAADRTKLFELIRYPLLSTRFLADVALTVAFSEPAVPRTRVQDAQLAQQDPVLRERLKNKFPGWFMPRDFSPRSISMEVTLVLDQAEKNMFSVSAELNGYTVMLRAKVSNPEPNGERSLDATVCVDWASMGCPKGVYGYALFDKAVFSLVKPNKSLIQKASAAPYSFNTRSGKKAMTFKKLNPTEKDCPYLLPDGKITVRVALHASTSQIIEKDEEESD